MHSTSTQNIAFHVMLKNLINQSYYTQIFRTTYFLHKVSGEADKVKFNRAKRVKFDLNLILV